MFTHCLTKLSTMLEVPMLKSKNSALSGELQTGGCESELPTHNVHVAQTPSPYVTVSRGTQASPSFAQQMEREDASGKGDQCGSCSGIWAAGVLPVTACLPAAGAVSCHRYCNSRGRGVSQSSLFICVPQAPPVPDKVCVAENRAVYQVSSVTCQPSSWDFTNIPQQQVVYGEGVFIVCLYLNNAIKAIINRKGGIKAGSYLLAN